MESKLKKYKNIIIPIVIHHIPDTKMMKILYFIVVLVLCNFDCMKAMDEDQQKMISSGVGNPLNVYGTYDQSTKSSPHEKKNVTHYSSLVKSIELLPRGIQRKIIAKIIGIVDEKSLESVLTIRYGLRLYDELFDKCKPVKIGNRNFSSIELFRMSQKKRNKIIEARQKMYDQNSVDRECYNEVIDLLDESERSGLELNVIGIPNRGIRECGSIILSSTFIFSGIGSLIFLFVPIPSGVDENSVRSGAIGMGVSSLISGGLLVALCLIDRYCYIKKR